ncbi:MAG TPA: hypothetical protein VMH87_20715 [Pseudomonadales bacterium]|nr:hypothetical protein [Pseudomonadales bacterium]
MKLHSPNFEKALKRGVKSQIRGSPELKREYRKAKKAFRKRSRINWLFRPVWSFVIGLFVWVIARETGHPASGLAIINLLMLLSLSIFAQSLLTMLFRAGDLPALALMPISEAKIFRWELQKFFFRHALFSIFDIAAGFIALAASLQFSLAQSVMAGACAALSWVMLLALAAFCAARLPHLPYQRITGVFFIFGFALFAGHSVFGRAVLNFFDGIAPVLNLISPTGWAPSLFQLFLPEANRLEAILIVPIALVILSVRNSLQLLQSRLKFKEHAIPEVRDQIPGVKADDPNQPSRAGITAIEDIIQSRQFLEPKQAVGWFEKRLWKWLTPRERSLVEFAFPKGLVITRPWISILRNFLLMMLIGYAVGLLDLHLRAWVFGVGLFITLCQCLVQIWSNGAAFRIMFNGGILIPIYAAYPIAFRDLSRTFLKLSVIQLPMFLVYTTVSMVLLAPFLGLVFFDSVVFGFKAGLLIFASRFIITIMAFSARTNDTARFRVRTIALILIFLLLGCLFLGLSGAGLFVPNAAISWLVSAAAVFDAYALLGIYGWFFNAYRFDLMSVPRR